MKNGIKKIIWLYTATLLIFLSQIYAVSLQTIKWNIGSETPTNLTQVDGSRSVFDIIKVVNSYLRFSIGFVCFLFMIINGYKLITAHGDENQTKNATSAIRKLLIWIIICLFAYIIVNLAVKLFA